MRIALILAVATVGAVVGADWARADDTACWRKSYDGLYQSKGVKTIDAWVKIHAGKCIKCEGQHCYPIGTCEEPGDTECHNLAPKQQKH
jgi:hypothetical protein